MKRSPPRLLILTDTTAVVSSMMLERLEAAQAAAAPGTVAVVLRDKQLPARERLALGRRLRGSSQKAGQALLVADRLDLAVLLDADGVHLPESGVGSGDARRLLGAGAFLTRAWHDPGRVPPPELDGVLLSPVVAARKGNPALGVQTLKAFAARTGQRVYALGGVDALSSQACLGAGATGVAVIGAVLKQPRAEPLLRALSILR